MGDRIYRIDMRNTNRKMVVQSVRTGSMSTTSGNLTYYYGPLLSLHIVSKVFSCRKSIVTNEDVEFLIAQFRTRYCWHSPGLPCGSIVAVNIIRHVSRFFEKITLHQKTSICKSMIVPEVKDDRI